MTSTGMQYLALIHKNADTTPTPAEWSQFCEAAARTGLFQGGSEIGTRQTIGQKSVPDSSQSIGGFMRFDSDDPGPLLELLKIHPVVRHGGTVELFTMPES